MKTKKLLIAILLLAALASCEKKDSVADTSYEVVDTATAHWKGFLRSGYFNEGSIPVASENLVIKKGKVLSGTFKMPLSGIQNFNLPTAALKQQLVHHLQSADFFNMIMHPDIEFVFHSSTAYTGDNPDAVPNANYNITGTLKILGKPKSITFPARIQMEGKKMVFAAKVKVNRLDFGMTYNSDESLPDDEYIMPEMEINFNIIAVIEK